MMWSTVFVVSLLNCATLIAAECTADYFLDGTNEKCSPCQFCFKDSTGMLDNAVIMPECEGKNPHPAVRDSPVYRWCDNNSTRLPNHLSTTTRTATPGTTTPLMTTPLTTPVPLPSTTTPTELGFYVILALVAIVLLTLLVWRVLSSSRRCRRNDSYNAVGFDGTCSTSLSAPLLPQVTVFPHSRHTSVGKPLTLITTNPWPGEIVAWQNISWLGELYIGERVHFPEASPWHAGKWINYFGTKYYDPSVSIYVSREGVEQDWISDEADVFADCLAIEYPIGMESDVMQSQTTISTASLRSSDRSSQSSVSSNLTAAGPEPNGHSESSDGATENWHPIATEPSDYSGSVSQSTAADTGYSEQIEGIPLVCTQQRAESDDDGVCLSVQPQFTEGFSTILPSSRASNALELLRRLMTSQISNSMDRCTLCLQSLLDNHEAMMQLAILMDPTSALRLVAAVLFRLTVDEIKFVWYITRGKGNTIRGMLEYAMHHKAEAHWLTAADFITQLLAVGWQGSDKVIGLLHLLHPQCPQCAQLYIQHGVAPNVNALPPGVAYHVTDQFLHCNQTVKSLARHDEEFRQESSIYFMPDDLWWQLGSDLVGIETEILEHLETHYRRMSGHEDNCYLQMLDRLTYLFPDMKIATIIQWCLDHNKPNAATIIYKYHIDCPCCRLFALNLNDLGQ